MKWVLLDDGTNELRCGCCGTKPIAREKDGILTIITPKQHGVRHSAVLDMNGSKALALRDQPNNGG